MPSSPEEIKQFESTIDAHSFKNECYIIGGGPSLKGFDWSLLEGKFVIAINRAYEVVPNAQILYFTDPPFFNKHRVGMEAHGGSIVRGATSLGGIGFEKVVEYKLTGPGGLEKASGCLKHGSNSAYAAINLAGVHLGFNTIYLLGLDQQYNGKVTHFHDGHDRIDPPAVFDKCGKMWKTLANPLQAEGIMVYNVNNSSSLNVFPMKSYEMIFGSECFNNPTGEDNG